MGQMLGADASVPVAAQYPTHPITEGFRVMTAYPLARSMTPVEGGANGHTAQPLREDERRRAGRKPILRRCRPASGQVEFNADKGDKQGPVTLGAAVSAPATETPPPPAGNASRPIAGCAEEAGNARRRDRRFRLRRELSRSASRAIRTSS